MAHNYWIDVLNFYHRNHFVNNGLTIPFLIGCRPKVVREPWLPLNEFIYGLYICKTPITMMTCENIGQVVISTADQETVEHANRGIYRRFKGIIIIDDTFPDAANIADVVQACEALYSIEIQREKFSFESGKWVPFSQVDLDRFRSFLSEELSDSFPPLQNDPNSPRSLERAAVQAVRKKGEKLLQDNIIPLWQTVVEDIDFSLQPNNLDASRMAQGVEIIDVDVDVLLASMEPDYAKRFRKKALFTSWLDGDKIARAILHWQRNEELIPPTITFEEPNFAFVYPTDGKHRLNAAISLGATTIPIVILSTQRDRLLALFANHSTAKP